MARVLVVDDFVTYAEMMSLLLKKHGGFEVKSEILPFEVREIHAFRPDVVIISLVRKIESLRSPLVDFFSEVDGAKALRAFSEDAELRPYPLVVTAIAVEERELPPDSRHLAFIDIPHRLEHLPSVLSRIAEAHGRGMLRE